MSNILSEVHPELVAEWSDKNLPLTPDRITYGSNKVVWWKGACGHEWQTTALFQTVRPFPRYPIPMSKAGASAESAFSSG